MVYDIRFTLANKSYIAQYEQSFVMRFVHERFPGKYSGVLVGMTETACIILLPMAFTLEANLGISMAIAWLFAVLHIVAVSRNKEFVRHRQDSVPT